MMSMSIRASLNLQLLDDMQALGADFVYRWLLLSLSGLKIHTW